MLESIGKYSVCTTQERLEFEREYKEILKENQREFENGITEYIVKCKYTGEMLKVIESNGYYCDYVLDQRFRKKYPKFEFKKNKKYICHITEQGYLIKCEIV